MTAPEESSNSVRVRYADPELIRNAVRGYARDLRTAHPEVRSIRWFGSWVNDTASVGSDVDLCIVIAQSEKPPRDRMPDYLPLSFPVGIDLFVYTEAELAQLRKDHASFAAAIDRGVEV